MKKIKLPSSHAIFNSFPNLDKDEISIEDFKSKVHSSLKDLYDESDRFFLQREVYSPEHVNWRYPIMTPYFIKDYIKNKHVMSIGSRYGEICEGLSRYAKKVTSVEFDYTIFSQEKKLSSFGVRRFKCERVSECIDVLSISDFSDIDVFYLYTTFTEDIKILKHINSHVKKESDVFLGFPQQGDKINDFLHNLKELKDSEDSISSIDYIPILWDESLDYQRKYDDNKDHQPLQHPVTHSTLMTDRVDIPWSVDELFDSQCGVFLLIKVKLNEGR